MKISKFTFHRHLVESSGLSLVVEREIVVP